MINRPWTGGPVTEIGPDGETTVLPIDLWKESLNLTVAAANDLLLWEDELTKSRRIVTGKRKTT